ncbi:MAG: JAB domain-containing protein [Anaerolineales bacterium]|nr:MAG: JAB domain-containing protein [Anaerolineales bacterium]
MDPVYRIKDIRTEDRPRERMLNVGPGALSNAELIAILLGSGMRGTNAVQLGQRLLSTCSGLDGLHRSSIHELELVKGIGIVKAIQIKAAIELGRRLGTHRPVERPQIQSPEDAAELILYEMGALEQEHLRTLLLDTRNRLIKIAEIYRGTLNSSHIRVGEVFREAVRIGAAALIVVHNHPSGDPTPSPEDVAVTKVLVEAGKLLDIEVLDHLVIGTNCFLSLKARGLGFS